ncbi:MAG: tetratricopeptide repeat protein [Verrucomicrobiae bacterium]|nr:tetratricopeptide repeat protein [Verrucomicrobiae bacterium]
MQNGFDNRRTVLWTGFVLVTVTLVLYWPATKHGFLVIDDNEYVTENPWVTRGLSLPGLKWALTAMHAANWHPVTWLSHMLDYEIHGLFAGGHHLTNIILHALNTLLLFLLLRRWTGSIWRSALVAALFGWHPLRVESVAWVAERKDVLSTWFMLLALLAYTGYAQRRTATRYALALGLFALGLMSKPMLVTLPLLLLLLDYWPFARLHLGTTNPTGSEPQKLGIRILAEKVPFFGLTAISCILTLVAQRAGGAVKPLEEVPLSLRLFNSLAAYLGYISKTLWPSDLCVYYPLPQAPPIGSGLLGALAVSGVTYAALRLRARCPWFFVGWLWFVIALVPVIGLVQVGNQAMADRYTYIPSIGLLTALVWCAANWLGRYRSGLRIGAGIAGAILVCCIVLTRVQLGYWRDSVTLMSRAVRVTKRNAFAHLNLGVAFANLGKMEAAVEQYRAAIEFRPNDFLAHNNLGVALTALGRHEEAAAHYSKALELNPKSALAHNNFGVLLAQQGKLDQAIEHFKTAIRLNPRYPKPYLNYGFALQKLGQAPQAITNYVKALELDPDWPEALDKLAFLLAACPDEPSQTRGAAIKLAERAVRLTGAQVPDYIATLAFAHAASGDFSNAAATAELALAKARENGLTRLAEQLESELALYRARQVPAKDWRNPR